MASGRLPDKEQALIDAARRELAARRGASPPGSQAPLPAIAHTTPLDQPTVMGWDHPAAVQAAPRVKVADPAQDRWGQVAALMEAERQAETERRTRLRQRALYALLAIAVAMLALVLLALRK